ncbi:MAG: ABC transporter ATP-binding protein/permease, partial [Clostridia bacterium]|nr:ABC transporter ATP-binding protein/permease [Clostridia bacterium]
VLKREDANYGEFSELTGQMKRASIRSAVLSALFLPIVTGLGVFATSMVLWRGGHTVLAEMTGLTIGTLAAFVQYTTGIFEPISNIARIFAELQASQAAAERVMSLLNTEPEIFDRPEIVEKFRDAFSPKKEHWPSIRGDVTFDHASFAYDSGAEVLNDFCLEVHAGQTVALVGETGSGKSTIVNLICRFYEPQQGRVLIDGVDIRDRSILWLQSHLGYVLQQPHLFSGTIRENLRFGRLDATDEEIEQAVRMVNAEDFILSLENGYDTFVGEGGSRLSMGQKQLISFARALIADPAIFILDEATSSVDTETEHKIQEAIATALKGRTGFIIAHRLSTIRNADIILVIQNGKIVEHGNHRELLRQRGYYHSLYVNQFRDEGARVAWREATSK